MKQGSRVKPVKRGSSRNLAMIVEIVKKGPGDISAGAFLVGASPGEAAGAHTSGLAPLM